MKKFLSEMLSVFLLMFPQSVAAALLLDSYDVAGFRSMFAVMLACNLAWFILFAFIADTEWFRALRRHENK